MSRSWFLVSSAGYLAVLSLGAHKEDRFLIPVLPATHLLLAKLCSHAWRGIPRLLWGIVVAHGLLAGYLLHFHQAGVESSVRSLTKTLSRDAATVLVLAPCYTVPLAASLTTTTTVTVSTYITAEDAWTALTGARPGPDTVHVIEPACHYPPDTARYAPPSSAAHTHTPR